MIDKWQQWFFLGVIVPLVIIAPIIVYFTHSSFRFTDYAPPAYYLLYLLAQRIFPPGNNETKIARPKSAKKRRFR
jgi:hypothetical protein